MHALREPYRYRVNEYESFSIYEKPATSRTTQARPREIGRRVQWDRDVNLLKRGLTPIRTRTRDKWSCSATHCKKDYYGVLLKKKSGVLYR